jgi:hemerythrin
VAKLDDQHAIFIGNLNRLHAAMIRGKGRQITGPLLEALIAAAREHIAAEEELMASTNYPGLAEHRSEHKTLTATLEELQAQRGRGDTEVSIALLRFMRDWISKHILEEDRNYAPWMQSHCAE